MLRLVIGPPYLASAILLLVNFDSFIELPVYVSPFRVRAPKRRV